MGNMIHLTHTRMHQDVVIKNKCSRGATAFSGLRNLLVLFQHI